jgi:predicted anti-sigma-YlaC factor YlaD
MAKRDCDREFEVLECAATGAPGEDLRAHIAGCESCRELFDVAHSVTADRNMLMSTAHPPSAGLVWWRVNMRSRREAARTAVRAGSFIQLALLIAAIAVGLAFLGISVDFHAVGHWIASSAHAFAIPLIALAVWLILAPVAVYFAVTDN